MVKIGFSACYFHPDHDRNIFKGKTLVYVEQSMASWLHTRGALCFMIPKPDQGVSARDYVREVDGLLLQGGSDMSPLSYGEKPLCPQWSGDKIRDEYEIELFHEALAQNKPVLGVCRGLQLINVARGGTLFQDIATQVPDALMHRSRELYDQNFHEIIFTPQSQLSELYSGKTRGKVNSVHHQAIKDLGKGLVVEAHAEKDNIIEAVRLEADQWVYAVQWHPEFQDPNRKDLLSPFPLLETFLDEAKKHEDR